jgi:signal transduction histidine kinase
VRHTVSTAAVFMRAGDRAPDSLAGLAPLRLIVARDSSAESYARRKQLLDRMQIVATTDDALAAVAEGRADACLSNQLVGLTVARQLGFTGRVVPVFTLPDSEVDFCFAVRPDDGELVTRLNDGLLIASERGDLQRHREKWLPAFESYWMTQPTVRRWLAIGAGAVALVALLSWWWYRVRLRAEHRVTEQVTRLVEMRTRELELIVGQLRASEEAIRTLNAELETRVAARTAELAERVAQVERLNGDLESFSYSVSHDLRAPLRNIAGFLELLEHRVRGRIDGDEARYIETVTRETGRLATLIDDLLAFSHLGRSEMKLEPVALAVLVADVQAEVAPVTPARGIEWRVGPLPVVQGDRALLRLVIANLLDNAVKFTRHRPVPTIEVTATTAGGRATVCVRDNGAGFNPKYADKLFGVFQRLHNQRDFEGTGIGLANVKRIVERHGGQVWAQGEVGQGAAFFFALPLAEEVA